MLVRLGDALASVPVEVVPTSFAALDGALGIGGIPCGRLAKLPQNLVVLVGGLVVTEQAPPTAKGHVFLTLEDETGLANVILRPGVYRRFRGVLQTDQMVLIEGVLKRQDRVTNLMARRIMSLHQEALVAGSCTKRPHRR